MPDTPPSPYDKIREAIIANYARYGAGNEPDNLPVATRRACSCQGSCRPAKDGESTTSPASTPTPTGSLARVHELAGLLEAEATLALAAVRDGDQDTFDGVYFALRHAVHARRAIHRLVVEREGVDATDDGEADAEYVAVGGMTEPPGSGEPGALGADVNRLDWEC